MRQFSRRLFRGCGLLALVVFPLRSSAEERVVAIGDVHGAYPEFVAILQRVGLIDEKHQWIGGSTILVQTGDVPDRGAQSRESLDLLMALEEQAPMQNGRVVPLLGNHEVMTMMGDLRYVSADDYHGFSTDQSEKVREEAFQEYKKFLSDHGEGRRANDETVRQQWLAEHPAGFFERHEAFGPEGVYGRWFRKHDAIGQIGDVLFMHGGLDPSLHPKNIRQINDRIRSELADFDKLWQSLSRRKIIWRYMTLQEAFGQVQVELKGVESGQRSGFPDAVQDMQKLLGLQSWMLMASNSPLWYRGLALDPEEKLKSDLQKMLQHLNVHYLVAAHTVALKFDVTPRFDNHVFLIDTGMLKSYYHGRASALEIQKGRFTAYYSDGTQQVLVGAPGGTSVPAANLGEGGGKQNP